MDLKLLEEKVKEMLPRYGFRLMRLGFVVEDKEKYLRVIVDKYHHTISLDEIVTLSEEIDRFLDEDDSSESFILDVTTTGAEKEVPLSELKDYVNTFVTVTLKDGVKGDQEYTGILVSLSDDELVLKINNKGRMQTRALATSDLKLIRRAVKG